MLSFSPRELEAEPAHRCLPWPFRYAELEPYYAQAEQLLEVRQFPVESDFRRIVAGLARRDSGWRSETLAVGLAANLRDDAQEARHFDGFASVRGLKSDAERCLLDRIRDQPNVAMLTGKEVGALLPAEGAPLRLAGVACADGSHYAADRVRLAAGALHSPRLLQRYLEDRGLDRRLPGAQLVGCYYKCHVLTTLMAFGLRPVHDVLGKTALLLHEALPHSSVQTLGGNLAEEIVPAQAPAFAAGALAAPVARRAYGFFLQTEDGSHPGNRVMAGRNGTPRIDHDFDRLPEARDEHRLLVRTLSRQLLRLGYLPIAKPIGLSGTAHACGTLVAGSDPQRSVVDPAGRVHGMENLYVVDGSILPRSSRVNPALTIYAWALRVADKLAGAPVAKTPAETPA